MRVRIKLHNADVDVQATLARALAADQERKCGLAELPRESIKPSRAFGFDNQRLLEDEVKFGKRRESGRCAFCTDTTPADISARGGWYASRREQSHMFRDIRTGAQSQLARKMIVKRTQEDDLPTPASPLREAVPTLAPLSREPADTGDIPSKGMPPTETIGCAPSARAHSSAVSTDSKVDDMRTVLLAIDSLRSEIEASLRILPGQTAEACANSILQLPKVPMLSRARLTDVHVSDQTVAALRVTAPSSS